MTTAELRVLHFLPSHLSFPEIAARLCVSPNTIKTHARAVYRKLDATSRAEAVVQGRAKWPAGYSGAPLSGSQDHPIRGMPAQSRPRIRSPRWSEW